MQKIALITDSTANIPQHLVDRYCITVLPQILIWGNETFRDGVDIQPDEFYRRLEKSTAMPSTSQVTPQKFQEVYAQLLDEGYAVLAILISTKLSGTVASALQARELFPGAPIEVIDSGTTAMAMGFQVLQAAQAIERGATLRESRMIAQRAQDNTGVLFAVDTLEFLYRGGRIGNGARLLGTAINLKPILTVNCGQVEPVERVRTRKKSLNRLFELVRERIGGQKPLQVAALHANASDEVHEFLEEVNQELNPDISMITEVSPVIGTHTGPGTVGLAYMAGV